MLNTDSVYSNMATLQKQKGKYWYIVESVRVKGKPRPKILAYLGKPEDLLEKLKGKKPVSSKSYEYGTVSVVDKFIKDLNISSLFNNTVFGNESKIPLRNNLNFGQTMSLIVLQRALQPRSKRAFSQWAITTFLPYMYEFNYKKIDSQHFWGMMDYLNEEDIRKIEMEITKFIIDKFNIKLDLLLYDYTNFYTWIDTNNEKNTITKRGKNKQKRNDLRQFCLALLVVRGLKIPLFSDIYEGNKSDTNEFSDSLPRIKERLLQLSQDIDSITIVFDKGSNSKKNFKELNEMNYVASLSLSHDKELKEIPFKKFYNLRKKTNLSGEKPEVLKCYRVKKKIWEVDRTVVMYKSNALFEGQLSGLKKDIKKIKINLSKLKSSANKGFYLKNNKKKPWTYELLERTVEETVNKQFARDIFEFDIKKLKNNCFDISFEVNKKKYNHLKATVLGKRILLTSRELWNDEEIIDAYHGQADVERSFRQIKNLFHNCVRPQYHWTDQKIMVHTFCSLLSLTISSLIEKAAKDNGFNMTINEIFNRLQDIRKAKYIYPGVKKNSYEIEYKLEEVTEDINLKLFKALMK